jgi:hypothetical protein
MKDLMKQTVFGVFLGAVGLLAASIPLVAHHGAASFDTTRELMLKGNVTEWIWANPHCFLKFDAKDDTGSVRNWAVEVSNPTDMTRLGWARTSFKGGDEVTVTLQPVKSGAPVGRLRSVVLANGQTLGTGGRGAPPPAPAADK